MKPALARRFHIPADPAGFQSIVVVLNEATLSPHPLRTLEAGLAVAFGPWLLRQLYVAEQREQGDPGPRLGRRARCQARRTITEHVFGDDKGTLPREGFDLGTPTGLRDTRGFRPRRTALSFEARPHKVLDDEGRRVAADIASRAGLALCGRWDPSERTLVPPFGPDKPRAGRSDRGRAAGNFPICVRPPRCPDHGPRSGARPAYSSGHRAQRETLTRCCEADSEHECGTGYGGC